jgi:hypothetical protein
MNVRWSADERLRHGDLFAADLADGDTAMAVVRTLIDRDLDAGSLFIPSTFVFSGHRAISCWPAKYRRPIGAIPRGAFLAGVRLM